MIDDVSNNQKMADEDESLIERIHKNLSDARTHLATWRSSAKDCYDFYAGRHWSQSDISKLEEEQRVPVTFNRIPRFVNAVCGLETQNRQEPRFYPREITDTGTSDVANGAMKYFRDQCDAEDEDSQMFSDAVISGYGWTETRLDYDENPSGDICIDRIDPFEMLYDPTSKKKNLADRRWQCHIKKLPFRDVKLMWPDIDIGSLASTFDFGTASISPHDQDNAWRYQNENADKNNQTLMASIGHYQEWEKIPYFNVQNLQTGETETLSVQQYQNPNVQQMLSIGQYKSDRRYKKIYRRVFFTGKVILQNDVLPCDDFTFNVTTGLYDRNDNVFFGLVQLMIHPQMWGNKWLSQVLHILNSNAKGGVFYETGAFASLRLAEANIAKPNGMIQLNQGGLAKIKERDIARYPEGLDRLLQYSIGALNEVTGISQEFLGSTDRDQPYSLEVLRQKQGTLILSPFFDALRRYRKQQGRLMLKYIKDYIADGRLVRIIGDEGAQYVPLLKDKMATEYDIVIDDAPNSPNVKERVAGVLMPVIQTAIQAGIPIPPDVLDYLPLPESLVSKWKQTLQGDPMQAQMQQALQQLDFKLAQLEAMDKEVEIQKKAAETRAVDSEITLNIAKAEQAHAIGEDEAAQAAQKLGIASQEAQAKQRTLLVEQVRKDIESVAHMRRKMMESQANIEIKREQARSTQSNK